MRRVTGGRDNHRGVWAWLTRNGPRHPRVVMVFGLVLAVASLVVVELYFWSGVQAYRERTGAAPGEGFYVPILLQVVVVIVLVPVTVHRYRKLVPKRSGVKPAVEPDRVGHSDGTAIDSGPPLRADDVIRAHTRLIRSTGIEVLVLLAVFVLGFVVSAWLRQAGVARWLADGFLLLCLAAVGLRLYLRRGLVDQLVESTARVHEARSRNPR